ncbi:PaaX family transcriptional regulator C-terminal domain-containing protein [Perlucidibaca aquatica]|uniref:PaaX family transcriptional regulator C-terminal domain-containing protein n=1 Tax=Perlucidibaca aquatica TaxID=1852776 RepID=UPI00083AEA57|nr:PaaX family transcriptional regulator C-terminal domain-containing protein [Perlucidibaca aquatica]
MKLNARHLILDLLLASDHHQVSVREAITACGIFAISENSVRVALVRLSADGLVQAAGRGHYRLGPQALDLAGDVATWRSAEQRLRPWHGDWMTVFTANLGRTNRTALKRRERALTMLGFRELEQGLHVRPNNLESGPEAVLKRLHTLGLEPEARLCLSQQWSDEAALTSLWDTTRLNADYRYWQQSLETWMQHAQELDAETAARESFLLGGQAIRHVVFDPLLPDSFIDSQARLAFVASVRTFDKVGHQIWQTLYASIR